MDPKIKQRFQEHARELGIVIGHKCGAIGLECYNRGCLDGYLDRLEEENERLRAKLAEDTAKIKTMAPDYLKIAADAARALGGNRETFQRKG
jgi:hypothetical protein